MMELMFRCFIGSCLLLVYCYISAAILGKSQDWASTMHYVLGLPMYIILHNWFASSLHKDNG